LATLDTVVVSFRNGDDLLPLLEAVRAQSEPDGELIVLDNASGDGTAELVAGRAPWARLIRSESNLGFAAGANRAAAAGSGELILFLNPDVVPDPGAIALLRAAADRWDLCQGLVTYPGGEPINTAGGEIHFSGIAWAGRCDRPVAEAGPERAIGFASGACMLISRRLWEELGGFEESFFMYCEDVDLSLRAQLAGASVGVVPGAVFHHEYSFEKGAGKWRLLERNRWLTILRTYPTRLLLAALPFLLALEIVLVAVALRGGWLDAKLRSQLDVLRMAPEALRQRRSIRRSAGVDFTAHLHPELDSPYFGAIGRSGIVQSAVRFSWRLIRFLGRTR